MTCTKDTTPTPFEKNAFAIDVSDMEFFRDSLKCTDLGQRLSSESFKTIDGISWEDMTLMDRMIVRSVREVRMHKFMTLFHEIRAHLDEFEEKARKASPVLAAFGEKVPMLQVTLANVHPDFKTATGNTDWDDNMQQAIRALQDCVDEIFEMRMAYWDALERISKKMQAA